MRLAVLSDIHGNLAALQAVLADLEAVGGADMTWILGDLVAFGPEPVATLGVIRALPEDKTQVIQGNTDRYVITGARPTWKKPDSAESWGKFVAGSKLRDTSFGWTTAHIGWEEAEYLLKLGTDLALEAPGFGWLVGFHAAPGDDEYVLLPDVSDDELFDALLEREGRMAFGGHTHLPMDRTVETWRMVNPGSVGLPFDGDQRAAYALVTFTDGKANVEHRRVAYDVEAVIARLEELRHPARAWVIERLRTAKAG